MCANKIVLVAILLFNLDIAFGMTRAQLKKTLTVMKKQCMPKFKVTEDLVGNIEQGVFIENHEVMCYITCVYRTIQVMKNDRLNKELVLKQVDILYPQEMRVAVKASIEKCLPVQDKYEDSCEGVYYSVKCLYETDPPNFMTRAQLKKTLTVMKKQCMPKFKVTEDLVGNIEQGVFIENHEVMCYITCVYRTIQVMKNDRLNKELVLKQVDILYPQEMRVAVKASIEKCLPVQDKYEDSCEGVYYSVKCLYETDPPNFVFP